MWSSRGRRMFPWYAEAAMLVGGYLAFGLIRAAVDGGASAATHLATVVQALERKIGIAVEYPLNHAMLPHPVLVYLTGYFYRLCLLAVPVILIWLWVRRPELYGRRRTVLVITTLIDLPLVRLFPESPPRFAQDGIIDYIATRNILGGASMAAPHSGVNLLAAMPSMHIAWTTWCAYAVWSASDRRGPRGAWPVWLFPACNGFCRPCRRGALRRGHRRRGCPGCDCGPADLPDRWPSGPRRSLVQVVVS